MIQNTGMKRFLIFFIMTIIWCGNSASDVRIASANSRSAKTALTNNRGTSNTSQKNVNTQRSAAGVKKTSDRSTENANISNRSGTTRTTSVSARTATQKNTRNISVTTTGGVTVSRSAKATPKTTARSVARAASITTTQNETFGNGVYNSCRDAYFTCMDQFCANQDDSYRRCVCSSRLDEIKQRERALGDTADSLQNFSDLNIDVINKTSNEVKAMISATVGEQTAANTNDTSNSAKTLAGISDVLTKSKSKSLSTNGSLDIAGDINAIWATTDLAGGQTIANLTGESLYNAVHAQCVDMVGSACESASTLNMVVSAYGMYIENDCAALLGALDQKKNAADKSIRQTEREMQIARLENYDAHNSTSINDCVALVRQDLTMDTACGPDYIHCLDMTGLYLNKTTGEPIYSANFYRLNGSISLDGDVIKNNTNTLLVNELNRMRSYATQHLNTCSDLADDVWNEFLRQAISEIYQGQQDRIRTVRNECLSVVSTCYDEQAKSLKDFSNIDEQLLLGSRLVTAEEMCKTKLETCSNLYGNGDDGMQLLVTTMHNLTDQKINQNCLATLETYLQKLCAPEAGDHTHTYPWGCRTLNKGTIAINSDIVIIPKEKTKFYLSVNNVQKFVIRAVSAVKALETIYAYHLPSTPIDGSRSDECKSKFPAKCCTDSDGKYTDICCFDNKCSDRNNLFGTEHLIPMCNQSPDWTDGIWKECATPMADSDILAKKTYTTSLLAACQQSYRCIPNGLNRYKYRVQYASYAICGTDAENELTENERLALDIQSATPIFYSDIDGKRILACQYPLNKQIYLYSNQSNNSTTLYSQVEKYATQVCMRPDSDAISPIVQQDVVAAMNALSEQMSKILRQECQDMGGVWDNSVTQYTDAVFDVFYSATATDYSWGVCKSATEAYSLD